jgi:hypothetical protein
MRIRLLTKWEWIHKTFYKGTVLEVSDGVAKQMIQTGTAEKYTGEYPPKEKMKTSFLNQKIK